MLYLGNKKVCPVKKVVETISEPKFGLTPDSIIGDVNSSGILQAPTEPCNLVFDGVTNIAAQALRYRFQYITAIKSVSFPDLTSLTTTGAMQEAFRSCTGITSISFPELKTISGQSALTTAFYGNTGLTSVEFPELTTLSGSGCFSSAFRDCSNITSISFPKLTTINGGNAFQMAFYNNSKLKNIEFPSLTSITTLNACSNAFYGCGQLESASFPELTIIGANSSSNNNAHFSQAFMSSTLLTTLIFPKLQKLYCTGGNSGSNGTFYNNNKVQKMYFPALDTITYGAGATSTNQSACKLIFTNCSSLTELHFGAANQAAIEASPGYSTAWGRGAGNVTIYFDL